MTYEPGPWLGLRFRPREASFVCDDAAVAAGVMGASASGMGVSSSLRSSSAGVWTARRPCDVGAGVGKRLGTDTPDATSVRVSGIDGADTGRPLAALTSTKDWADVRRAAGSESVLLASSLVPLPPRPRSVAAAASGAGSAAAAMGADAACAARGQTRLPAST
jgi:hypothetical protein